MIAAAAAVLVPAAAHAASTHTKSVLKQGVGMHAAPSVRVRALQRTLVRRGYSVGKTGIDGRFGPRTRAAVRRLQRRHHIKVDGVVGPRTRAVLRRDGRSHRATAKRHHTQSTKRSATAAAAATPGTAAAAAGATAGATAPAPAATAPEPTPTTTPARAPAATNPTSVHLTTSNSISPFLIMVPVLVLITALFVLAHVRQRRRHAARMSAYGLGTFVPPEFQQGDRAPDERPVAPEPQPAAPPRVAPARGNGAPVIGYVAERPATGRAPEQDIERACERSGWQLVEIIRDRENGSILERPGMARALERIKAGDAQGLVVRDARLLSRSADFASFVRWFRDADAILVALDLGLDTSTPEGRRVAGAMITLNGWAGDRLASRTGRNGAKARAGGGEPPDSNGEALSGANGAGSADSNEGQPGSGGGPSADSDGGCPRLAGSQREEALARIARLHEDDTPLQEIADLLNDEGVPTLFGTDRWWPSTVKAAVRYARPASATELEQLPATEGMASA